MGRSQGEGCLVRASFPLSPRHPDDFAPRVVLGENLGCSRHSKTELEERHRKLEAVRKNVHRAVSNLVSRNIVQERPDDRHTRLPAPATAFVCANLDLLLRPRNIPVDNFLSPAHPRAKASPADAGASPLLVSAGWAS